MSFNSHPLPRLIRIATRLQESQKVNIPLCRIYYCLRVSAPTIGPLARSQSDIAGATRDYSQSCGQPSFKDSSGHLPQLRGCMIVRATFLCAEYIVLPVIRTDYNGQLARSQNYIAAATSDCSCSLLFWQWVVGTNAVNLLLMCLLMLCSCHKADCRRTIRT